MLKFYKYQGAGNDFLIADNRDGAVAHADGCLVYTDGDSECRLMISDICDRRYGVGADGLMLLESSDKYDFRMTYFNSDGSGGMMCGNGGRCMVAFASDRGLEHFDFEAADGFHSAEILSSEGKMKTVRLKMKDVSEYCHHDVLSGVDVPSEGWFLETGTRHYVRFVKNIGEYDIVDEGRNIRFNAEELKPVGANVNFVEPSEAGIKVRTYEKGVEDETYACGTGITASAIASYLSGVSPSEVMPDGRVRYDVYAKRDRLAVDFVPLATSDEFHDVWLTGPAACVAEIIL